MASIVLAVRASAYDSRRDVTFHISRQSFGNARHGEELEELTQASASCARPWVGEKPNSCRYQREKAPVDE